MENLKDRINAEALSIFEKLGLDTDTNNNIRCPSHKDKNPSAKIYKQQGLIHCFTCRIHWDAIGAIQGMLKVDFKEALQIGGQWLGLDTSFLSPSNASKGESTPKLPKPPKTPLKMPSRAKNEKDADMKTKEDLEKAKKAKEDLEYVKNKDTVTVSMGKFGVEYLDRRGIDFKTALQVGVLEDEAFVHPNSKDNTNVTGCPALLFPVENIEGETVGFIARWTTENKPNKGKVQNVQGGEDGLFNIKALLQTEKPVFLTEGEIDTLTYLDAGYNACSFGSTSGVSKLTKAIEGLLEKGAKLPPLIISADNDEAGKGALEAIEASLKGLNVDYKVLPPFGDYKDANEVYTQDKPSFLKTISRVVKYEPVTESLNNTIARLFNELPPPPLKTGFANLDYILSGGLRGGGLVVVFGNPAAGKTAFCLQIADSLSKRGKDYLFFSLEITKKELLCRNLSRESFILALNRYSQDSGLDNKKPSDITVEDLLARPSFLDNNAFDQFEFSERYVRGMKGGKSELVAATIDSYLAKTQDRATVCSGLFDVTVTRIRQELDTYKARRGEYPALVVVDYAQIISPPDGDNMPKTDKQVADYNIKELKKIAGAYDVPFLVVASVNRESYKIDNREGLSIASAKESGGIEYTADVVLGLEVETLKADKADKNSNNGKPIETYEELEGATIVKGNDGQIEEKREDLIFSKLIRCKVFKNRWGMRGRAYFDYKPKYHFFRMVENVAAGKILTRLKANNSENNKGKKYLYTGVPAEELFIEQQERLINRYY